jgi:hypothetical protein
MVALIMKAFAVIGLTLFVYTWTLGHGGMSEAFRWGSLICTWSMVWAALTLFLTMRVPVGKG